LILFNNKSTVTIYCNANMVINIHNTNGKSLVTNPIVFRTTQKANIPGWGEVWFNSQAITNIFSYAKMAKDTKSL
jgi:hypothetical protein